MEPIRTGETVRVTGHRHTTDARVILASANGRSLMLEFDGGFFGAAGGLYVGTMPVLLEDDGRWVELLNGTEVQIERMPRC